MKSIAEEALLGIASDIKASAKAKGKNYRLTSFSGARKTKIAIHYRGRGDKMFAKFYSIASKHAPVVVAGAINLIHKQNERSS